MCIGSNSVNQAQDLMSVTKFEDFPNSLIPTPYCLCIMFIVPGEIGGQAVLHIWSHLHSLDRVSGSQISSVLHQLLFGSYDRTSHQQVFLFYVITIDYTRYIVHLL